MGHVKVIKEFVKGVPASMLQMSRESKARLDDWVSNRNAGSGMPFGRSREH